MDDERALSRAWSLERAIQDRCARTRREFEYGTALFNDSIRRVYDANFVRFERGFGELTGDVVEAAADRLQAGLGHRKVMIPDEPAGARVAAELGERGWRSYSLVTMAYEGPRGRDERPAPDVEQVDPVTVRRAREHGLDDGRRDPDARRQIVAFTELMASAVPTRLFAARAGGEVGSFCALFQRDGVGQIDEVTTIERHRRRGLGTAVVEGALRASLAAGDVLTFLVADESDWPKGWYGRLGFRPIGRRFELLRT
jgi:ribosomal protein S18 acetylase RimI-like enzyme